MNRISYFLLTIAAALYLFVNGILGITNRGGDFGAMASTILGTGDFTNVIIIILSICGIAAGIFLLLALFRVDVPITDIILLVFVVLWVIFIAIVDVLRPLNNKINALVYLQQLATHLMVLGALMASTKRFGYIR
ncbi:MAG: hypothetical protein LBU88_08610 [Treponema sp.]|jgi:hypothetical protein|nr:hypothetical protein [Treponema sp.]